MLFVTYLSCSLLKMNCGVNCILVWNKEVSKIDFFWPLLSLSLRNLEIIDMIKSCSNFYHFWKMLLLLFVVSCVCFCNAISLMLYDFNRMETKTSLLHLFVIKFLKTDGNLRSRCIIWGVDLSLHQPALHPIFSYWVS